ncbi:MAG: hypothetical protein N2517_05955 [Ignavibacteria bacterium]|nr:hypothetical protein [Ignavibacteria bacterium]
MIVSLKHPLLDYYLLNLKHSNNSYNHHWLLEQISNIVSILVTKDMNLCEPFPNDLPQAGMRLNEVLVFSVFPSGLTIANKFICLFPNSKIGYIGYQANKNGGKELEETVCLIPDNVEGLKTFLVDYSILSGETIRNAIARLQFEYVEEISVVTLFATFEGLENIRSEFPTASIYLCSVEEEHNIPKIDFINLKRI